MGLGLRFKLKLLGVAGSALALFDSVAAVRESCSKLFKASARTRTFLTDTKLIATCIYRRVCLCSQDKAAEAVGYHQSQQYVCPISCMVDQTP